MKYIAETKDGQFIEGTSVQDIHLKAQVLDAALVKITAVKDDGKRFTIQNK